MKYILTLLTAVFMISCATKQYGMNIHLNDNFSKTYAKEIVGAAYYAYSGLRNCDLPELYDVKGQHKLETNKLDAVEFKYGDPKYDKMHCAYVKRGFSNIIYINSNLLITKCKTGFSKWGGTGFVVAHEMLHLMGFSHKNTGQLAEFNAILDYCGF